MTFLSYIRMPRTTSIFIILVILGIFFLVFDLFTGATPLFPRDILSFITNKKNLDNQTITILSQFRLPRIFAAVFTGASLAVSGLIMQTIFRNPLAGPYVLGISAGASFGVAVLVLGASWLPFSIITYSFTNISLAFAAWIGSFTVLLLIVLISYKIKDIMTILILGVMFGSGIGAIVNIMQYFASQSALKTFYSWTMGSLNGVTANQIIILSIVSTLGILASFLLSKPLNTFLLGEQYAQSLGTHIRRTRFFTFLITSVLAGTTTAFCGPIGFIGISVPHVARMILKTSDHKILIPATAIIGTIMLLISDILSNIQKTDLVLPVNSIAAILGIPIIFWVIIKNKQFNQ